MSTSRTSTSPTRLARIRENQRRSRLRKREYISSLEQRLAQCRELGVSASVELQRSAQGVYTENHVLREMLAEAGVGQEVINERLLRVSGNGDENVCPWRARPCNGEGGEDREGEGEEVDVERLMEEMGFGNKRLVECSVLERILRMVKRETEAERMRERLCEGRQECTIEEGDVLNILAEGTDHCYG